MSNSIVNTINQLKVGTLIESSVMEFKGYARKTAENILEMGRVVCETKKALKDNKEDFEVFCSKVGFKSNSSSIKKLSRIGEGYLMMKSQADYLPNSWTTLYEISRLADSELKKYISEGVIHQNVLGSVIRSLNSSTQNDVTSIQEAGVSAGKERLEKVRNITLNGYSFLCEIADVDDLEVKSNLRTILKNLKDLKVKVAYSYELKNALNTKHLKAA
jgi:hypothetical protein